MLFNALPTVPYVFKLTLASLALTTMQSLPIASVPPSHSSTAEFTNLPPPALFANPLSSSGQAIARRIILDVW